MGLHKSVSCVALDVHRKFSQLCARDDSGKVVMRERLAHRDREALRERLSRYPAGTPVVLEASFGWGWMSDELLASSLSPHLASASKVAAWRKARGMAKSNRLDADLLSELWHEKQRWWEVWLVPQEVRDLREVLRHRMSLVTMQTQIKNRIHAILHRHGILHDHADLFGKAGMSFLQMLLADEQLRETARGSLKEDLALLLFLRKQIARATRLFRMHQRKDEITRRLATLPGVSTILAFTLAAEIGQIGRFKSSRRLISYALLAPVASDSGEEREGKPIGRHLGKIGRRTLQWAFIEAAHGAVKKDAFMREIFNRVTQEGQVNRGRGSIAVAHRLCQVTYAMLKHSKDYSVVPPPRPGSKPGSTGESRNASGKEGIETTMQSDGSSHPGTGQLKATMTDTPRKRAVKVKL